jgi:hypothetical protein
MEGFSAFRGEEASIHAQSPSADSGFKEFTTQISKMATIFDSPGKST